MKIRNIGPVIGCFASSVLITSACFADGYFGSVSATAFHSDNGNKSVDNKVSELQEQYNLNLGASYENYIGKFEADYGASYRSFSEETQPNKSALEGHSVLQLGYPSQLAQLVVEHSRQTLLNKPDSVDVTSNQDEREVISITPTLNWHFFAADTLFLQGNFSDIRYLENEINNSTRAGGTLGLLHRITEVDSLGLNIKSTNIDFEFFPQSNYALRSAMLTYAAKLRQLSYSVQVGGSQSETDVGEKYTDPSYLISLAFKSGVNTFSFNVAQELTDTSFGDGNKNSAAGTHSSDGGIEQSSQINRKKVDTHWTTTALCTRCTLTTSLYQTRDQYLSINERASESGVNIAGDYALSSAATLNINFTQSNNRLPGSTLGENYKRKIAALGYTYRLGKNFSVRASYSDEKRTDDNSLTGYREKLVGINLGYSF